MSVVFEGNTTPVSHSGKWSQWDLEPRYLILIRTCCETALIASTVNIKFSNWPEISDGEGCFMLITGIQQVVFQDFMVQQRVSGYSNSKLLFSLPPSTLFLIYFTSFCLPFTFRQEYLTAVSVLACWKKKNQHFCFSKVKLFDKEWSF